MKKLLVLLFTMAIVIACLPGCGPECKEVVFSCDDFEQKNNANAEIAVSKGETVMLTLCSNASTGFSWDEIAKIEHADILKQIGHEYVSPKKAMAGAAGQEKWTFEALKPGTSTAYLEYSRPWEGGEKGVWTFTLNVVVK